MLNHLVSMLVPQVDGFKVADKLREGTTATERNLLRRCALTSRKRFSTTSMVAFCWVSCVNWQGTRKEPQAERLSSKGWNGSACRRSAVLGNDRAAELGGPLTRVSRYWGACVRCRDIPHMKASNNLNCVCRSGSEAAYLTRFRKRDAAVNIHILVDKYR